MFSRTTRRVTSLRQLSLKSFNNASITVNLKDKTVSFDNVFLRDSCDSPDSVDASTRQKSFTTASITRNLEIAEPPKVVNENGEQNLLVKWKQGNKIHESRYSESFLQKSSSLKERFNGKFFPEEKVYWKKTDLVPNLSELKVDYNDYFAKDEVFQEVVNNLNKYGLSFIENVEDPQNDPKLGSIKTENEHLWPVAKLASRFGYIKKTFYGVLFDVKNEKNAKNIANTNVFLPLHMDLLYYEDRDPKAYEALKKVPITYHYNNNNEYYYYMRPLVVEDPYVKNFTTGEPQIKEVNYAPPFQGPFELNATTAEDPKLWQEFCVV
ncbi:hypothetical protein CJJ09_001929 [Candidozyma auris]|nr:hypothetical protein CJJ09_001929 [[Candida] auris]